MHKIKMKKLNYFHHQLKFIEMTFCLKISSRRAGIIYEDIIYRYYLKTR